MKKILDLTKKIVEIPSVSGNEKSVLEFTADFLRKQGGEVWQNEDFAAGLFRGKKSKKAVILTGHLDTVSEGDLENWENSPWELQNYEDRISGLGVCDMKTAIAVEFIAGIDFVKKQDADFDLWLVAVANEEVDGTGSARFAEWFKAQNFKYESICGIIGEPTNLEQIEVGHRGNRFVKLSFSGVSGHASIQDNFKKSALAKANLFLNNIDKIVESASQKYKNEILGSPTFVPTSLNTGNEISPNKTTATAKIILDIRTTPEIDSDFENFWDKVAEQFDFSWEYTNPPVPSSLISSQSEVVKNLLEASKLPVTAITVSPGATDQGEFVKRLGAEVIVFGPGDFSQAHRQNEYIFKSKIEDFYKIITNFLEKN